MPEKKCKYCVMMIPEEAKYCPYCRKRQGAHWFVYLVGITGLLFISVIFTGILMSIIGAFAPSQPKTESQQKEDLFSAARGICRLQLEKILHDPDSAKFDSVAKWNVEQRTDGTILVQPSLRAKNAFGAYIYATYDCVAKPEGEYIKVVYLVKK